MAARDLAFQARADRMATEDFTAGLAELLRTADDAVRAIMCSEAVLSRCHRLSITDALIVTGVKVFDVMLLSTTHHAELTPFARVHQGKHHLSQPRTRRVQ